MTFRTPPIYLNLEVEEDVLRSGAIALTLSEVDFLRVRPPGIVSTSMPSLERWFGEPVDLTFYQNYLSQHQYNFFQ